MPAFGDPGTLARIRRRFGYAFEQSPGSPHRPVLEAHEIAGPFRAGGLAIEPSEHDRGSGQTTLGFRIGSFAYSTDAVGFSEGAYKSLEGLKAWIVDCFGEERHPTHANWSLTLSWIERVKPARAILTHMGPGLDYDALTRRCPPNVEPGYDGMVIELWRGCCGAFGYAYFFP